jgi:putative ABC transport system ATP-binding protein
MIELVGVSKTYEKGTSVVRALDEVSLDIADGSFVAIQGPSGSGKSTMMNIVGLLDRPDRGTYRLDGTDVGTLSPDGLAEVRNARIGFVFQSFHLLGRVSALDNVALPLVYRGMGRKERRERAMDALEAVGLADRVRHRPNELSGGQQQRVAIARALVTRAEMLLADEPTGNLDTATGGEILDLLRGLHDERGTALVIISHDPEVAPVVDRVVELRDGVITAGSSADRAVRS